jgi:hypothetical protein
MPAKSTGKKKPSELAQLRARVAKALGVPEEEAELRALRELAATLTEPAGAKKSSPPPAASAGYLPQRLYLLLDGRGLDGRGMPVEVIELPCVVGSGKNCSVWINSPQIETRHLQITHGDEGWVAEDLRTEHGTFLGDQKIRRRILQHGDELRLAGYLRLRAELR